MARILIRSGYDFSRAFTFKKDSAVEDLSSATIKASLVNEAKAVELIVDTAQSSSTVGAAWASGVIVIAFTAAQTASLAAGNVWIEVAVTLSGFRLVYEHIPAVVEKGYTLS